MAIRRKAKENVSPYNCREFGHSYDWHEKGADGQPFLCRCPYKQQGGKFSIFLKDPACERFIMRKR